MHAMFFFAGPAALAGMPPPVASAPAHPPVVRRMLQARHALGEGRLEDALAAFEAAAALDARFALAHLGRATVLTTMGRDDEARAALDVALELSAGQEEVLVHLARMTAREGHTGVALYLLEGAIRARPELADLCARDPLFADHPAYLQALGRL